MKLQQLRYLVEVERRGLNVSEAAEALFTSQPGISKQISLLEEELGVTIFERSGKRLTGVTEPGRWCWTGEPHAERSAEPQARRRGLCRREGPAVAGHHPHPGALRAAAGDPPLRRAPPGNSPALQQGSPAQVAEWVLAGKADIGIATEALDRHPQLMTLPCYQWAHMVVTPKGHPLLATGR